MPQSYPARLVQLPCSSCCRRNENASTIETIIAPITIFLVLLPTIDNTKRASLLCKFVSCIAAAKNNAAATRATAEVAYPLNANDNA